MGGGGSEIRLIPVGQRSSGPNILGAGDCRWISEGTKRGPGLTRLGSGFVLGKAPWRFCGLALSILQNLFQRTDRRLHRLTLSIHRSNLSNILLLYRRKFCDPYFAFLGTDLLRKSEGALQSSSWCSYPPPPQMKSSLRHWASPNTDSQASQAVSDRAHRAGSFVCKCRELHDKFVTQSCWKGGQLFSETRQFLLFFKQSSSVLTDYN